MFLWLQKVVLMAPDEMPAQAKDAAEDSVSHIGEDPEAEGVAEDVERAESLVNRATEAIAAGQTGRALNLCRDATIAAPSMVAAWTLRGMVAQEAGKHKEALQAYRRVGELDPERQGLQETIAGLEGLVAEEEEAAQAAAARGPGFLERYSPAMLAGAVGVLILVVGIVLIAAHSRGAADAQYRQIMDQGYQALGAQQFDQAEQYFTDALRLRPNDTNALTQLQNARDGRERAKQYAQWRYQTANGKYPGAQQDLSGGVILPTQERKAQEAAAAAAAGGGGGEPRAEGGGGDTNHGYSWRSGGHLPGTGGSIFPSPTDEGEDYAPTAPSTTGSQPQPQQQQQPVAPQPQPQPSQVQPQLQPGATTADDGATEEPQQSYLHITVGEPPKPTATATTPAATAGPTGDTVRAQADALRRAGRNAQARKLYQQAIDLYQKEGQADPQTRAVKQSEADYCRRALEQSK